MTQRRGAPRPDPRQAARRLSRADGGDLRRLRRAGALRRAARARGGARPAPDLGRRRRRRADRRRERRRCSQPGDEATRTYRNVQQRLGELRRATGAARIYVFAARRHLARATPRAGVAIGERYYALDADRSELRARLRRHARRRRCCSAATTARSTSPASRRCATTPARIAFAVGVDGAGVALRAARRLPPHACSPSAPAARWRWSRSRCSSRACSTRPIRRLERAPPSASARGDLRRAGARETRATRSASSPRRWSRCASSCARATSACR